MASDVSVAPSAASRFLVGSIVLGVAMAVFGLLCIPASPAALARPDLRVGVALLCAVLFAFGVGYLAHGRWFMKIDSPPWRVTKPSAKQWGRWMIDIAGITLLVVAGVTGIFMCLRSLLIDR